MKNFVQPGNSIDAVAPAGGVVSGTPLLIGSLFGVPVTSAAEGETFTLNLVGVYNLPKAAGAAWAIGDKLYWDNTNKVLTKTASGNTLVAVATSVAASGDVKGDARLGIVT